MTLTGKVASHWERVVAEDIARGVRGVREVTDNIAHDMRQPISRLRNRIELSLIGSEDPVAREETLRSFRVRNTTRPSERKAAMTRCAEQRDEGWAANTPTR